jgi:hypothetical protein
MLLCCMVFCAVLCVVQQCEDLEDTTSLQHLFRILRSMVMLNDTQVCVTAAAASLGTSAAFGFSCCLRCHAHMLHAFKHCWETCMAHRVVPCQPLF